MISRQLSRLACLACLAGATACSPKRIAEGSLADALAAQGDSFQSDDDPRLVEAAIPFGLKVMESLLSDLPRHEGLLLSACSGFTGFGYAFVQEDAEESPDPAKTEAGRKRAAKLFARARSYCLRGLDVAHPGLAEALTTGNPRTAVSALNTARKEDVPLLYWTAVSWSLLISDSLNDMAAVASLPVATALASRALALDPGWNGGNIYDFFVALDAARGVDQGGGPQKAKADLDQSLALSHGTRMGPILSYAEGVLVPSQDRKGFEAALDRVLSYDVDAPEARSVRLLNVLAQRRARWLRSRLDELFL